MTDDEARLDSRIATQAENMVEAVRRELSSFNLKAAREVSPELAMLFLKKATLDFEIERETRLFVAAEIARQRAEDANRRAQWACLHGQGEK